MMASLCHAAFRRRPPAAAAATLPSLLLSPASAARLAFMAFRDAAATAFRLAAQLRGFHYFAGSACHYFQLISLFAIY
jgi:hypothetical protein